MKLELSIKQASKRFDRHWIFKEIDLTLHQNDVLVVLGNNGSGKSTFIKMLSGYLKPSLGAVQCQLDEQPIAGDKHYAQVALAAPYAALLDDLTLSDQIKAHAQFLPWRDGLQNADIAQICMLDGNENKPIKAFSSGMKQRLKLGLAILSQRPILLLDEPTSNLDLEGVEWYKSVLLKHMADRIVVIGTNEPQRDAVGQTRELTISDYKG